VGASKGVLDDIFGVLPISHHSQRDAQGALEVSIHQQLEGAFVSSRRPGCQLPLVIDQRRGSWDHFRIPSG